MKERFFIPILYILVTSVLLYFLGVYFPIWAFEYKEANDLFSFALYFGATIIHGLCCGFTGFALSVIICPTFEVFDIDTYLNKTKRKKLEWRLGWRLIVSDLIGVITMFGLMMYGFLYCGEKTRQLEQNELSQNGIVQKVLVANVEKGKNSSTITFYAQIEGKSVKSQVHSRINLVENDTLLVRISAKKPMIAELIEVFPID